MPDSKSKLFDYIEVDLLNSSIIIKIDSFKRKYIHARFDDFKDIFIMDMSAVNEGEDIFLVMIMKKVLFISMADETLIASALL